MEWSGDDFFKRFVSDLFDIPFYVRDHEVGSLHDIEWRIEGTGMREQVFLEQDDKELLLTVNERNEVRTWDYAAGTVKSRIHGK